MLASIGCTLLQFSRDLVRRQLGMHISEGLTGVGRRFIFKVANLWG